LNHHHVNVVEINYSNTKSIEDKKENVEDIAKEVIELSEEDEREVESDR
jgi:hypothetical protein